MAGDSPAGRNPIAVRGLDHIVLRVSDLDAMIAFYGEVLGCPVERRQDEIGLVQLRAGHALIDLLDPERNTVELKGLARQ